MTPPPGFPPGSRAPRLVQTALMAADPYGYMRRRRRRYGPVFSARFPFFGRVVYVADPDEIKRVFAGDPASFHAGEANATVLGTALGDHSLLTLDEDRHMSQRKLLLPAFHGERIRGYTELMAEASAREIATWPVGEPLALRPRMQAITLEVILRAVFGVREGARMELFRERIPKVGQAAGALNLMPFMQHRFGGLGPAERFRRRLAAVDELIYAEIRDRRAQEGLEDRDDVLSTLLCARHEDGSPMTDTELRDELMTLLTAGHETTATGLSWAFERLTRSPEAMARTIEHLDDDAYLDAVVKETLRIRPVVNDVARKLTRDTEVAGYRLPAGTLVIVAISTVHWLPEVYPQPWEFRPERHLEGQAEPYTWIPFGGGVRRCIGASFAQTEMRVVLREVLRRVRMRADRPEGERSRVEHVTVVPARDARVVVTSRVPALAASGLRSGSRDFVPSA